VTFASNTISKPVGFPNLRHNVFVSNGAVVSVVSMRVDTDPSYFVYISDDGSNSAVSGLDV
jgi:hypothetical protein